MSAEVFELSGGGSEEGDRAEALGEVGEAAGARGGGRSGVGSPHLSSVRGVCV